MASNTEEYYTVLGVRPNASFDEIKRAYRVKAFHLHPDRNTSPDANEEFVLLNEAYQYLLAYKQGKFHKKDDSQYQRNWEDYEKENARTRAREYARMRWEEYLSSAEYKAGYSLDVILTHVMYLFMWAVLIAVPIIATVAYGIEGFLGSLIPLSVLGWFLLFKIKEENNIDFSLFRKAINYIGNTLSFYIGLSIVFNVFVLLKIELQTLVPVIVFPITILAPAIILNIVLWQLKTHKLKRIFFSYSLWPFAVSIFFLINFTFNSNSVQEKYFYHRTTQGVRGKDKGTSYIRLERNVYDEYPGIRYFIDYKEVKTHNVITYTFADGLFGMRVMKTYEFTLE